MDYEKATDKDLNDKLREFIYGDDVKYWMLSDDESFIYDCGPTGDQLDKIELQDYCNDWNETMPLFMHENFTLLPGNSLEGYFKLWCCHGGRFEAFDKNPLRAIVICLIKVLES